MAKPFDGAKEAYERGQDKLAELRREIARRRVEDAVATGAPGEDQSEGDLDSERGA